MKFQNWTAAGVVLLVGALAPVTGRAAILETLTDRCKTSVRIEPALIFDQDEMGMVHGFESPISLKRTNPNAFTPFTTPRSVGLPLSGRFNWFCGSNADSSGGVLEHSNCPSGTNRMSARLGPDRLLEIRCLD